MKTMEDVSQFAIVLLSSVGGAAVIITAIFSWFGKIWASRILESYKAKYTKELDKIRHQFNIDLNQLSIIHENQKSSFQRVIKSLQKSIKALEQEYDVEWHPISNKCYDELEQVVIEESLFLGNEGERALNIFLFFFGRAVAFPEGPDPKDKTLRNIYEHMIFMSERIREYFRKRIGLSEESDPLFDVNFLAACLLINECCFDEIDFPTQSVLKFNFETSPQALVDRIKENIYILKSDLKKIITFLESNLEEKKYSFRTLSEARYYLKILEKA